MHAGGGTDLVTKRQSPTPAVEGIHVLSLLVLTYTCLLYTSDAADE